MPLLWRPAHGCRGRRPPRSRRVLPLWLRRVGARRGSDGRRPSADPRAPARAPQPPRRLAHLARYAWRRGRRRDADGALGRRDPQGRRQLHRLRRADPRVRRPLAGPDQGRRGTCERRARPAGPRQGRAHRRRRRARCLRRARRPVSDRRLPDRLRDLLEHERERGPGHTRRRRCPRERRRQHGPVVERRLPVGRPSRGARAADARPAAGARHARGLARAQGDGVRRRRQVRSDAPDGRRAGDARPGILGLRGAGPAGRCAGARHARARRPDSARRDRRRHWPEHAPGVRRARQAAPHGGDRTAGRSTGRPVRGPGCARRSRRGVRSAEDGGRLADEDRERPSPARLRSESRSRRNHASGAPEGQLDHAREGQPRHPRGRDPGVGAGDWQRHRDHGRRHAGPPRAERLRPAARPEFARVDQAPRRRLATPGGEVR